MRAHISEAYLHTAPTCRQQRKYLMNYLFTFLLFMIYATGAIFLTTWCRVPRRGWNTYWEDLKVSAGTNCSLVCNDNDEEPYSKQLDYSTKTHTFPSLRFVIEWCVKKNAECSYLNFKMAVVKNSLLTSFKIIKRMSHLFFYSFLF